MYSLIFLSALASPEQVCPSGGCPLQRVATVALAPVSAVHDAVRGGCQGRSARFAVVPRAARGGCAGTVTTRAGCVGTVAATAPPVVVVPPMPMVAPPVPPAAPPIAPEPVKVASVAAVPVVSVAAVKHPVDVFKKARLRTFAHNRLCAGLPF